MTELRPVLLEGTFRSGSPLVPAIVDGDTVYVSGCVPVSLTTGTLVSEDIDVQTRQVIDNLAAVLRASGSDLAHVVKTTVFITEQSEFQAMNKAYAAAFGEWLPARTTVVVAALARDGFRVEIEAVAKVIAS